MLVGWSCHINVIQRQGLCLESEWRRQTIYVPGMEMRRYRFGHFGVGCSWVQSAIAEDEVVARMAMIGLKKYYSTVLPLMFSGVYNIFIDE
jgi:hypothetical protein